MEFCVTVVGVSAIFLVALTLLTATRGGRGYFSPYTLEYYTQSEITIFIRAWPIYHSTPKKAVNEMLNYLVDSGYVAVSSPENDIILPVFHWNSAEKDGHSMFYKAFMSEHILKWSKQNTELGYRNGYA